MSRWPYVVLLLATRCLPAGGSAHLSGTGHLKRWPNSAWGQVIWKDDLILLLATRCLYQGVKDDLIPLGDRSSEKMTQFCSWPLDASTRGQFVWWVQVIWKGDLILLLATRCQYWGVSSSEGTPCLKIWTRFEIYLLLHRGLFYERPISSVSHHMCTTVWFIELSDRYIWFG